MRDLALVRVRVREALPRVRVRGMDLQLRDAAGTDRGYEQVTQWELYCRDGRIRARNAQFGEMDLASPVALKARGGFISVRDEREEAQFNGEIRVVTSGFLCEVVNVLPTEKYLEGVVNSEFSSKWNVEAVEAQIVAARSYAASQMRAARDQPGSAWDLDATTNDQVYHGTAREDPQAARLVRRTEGLALITSESGKVAPLKAFYHSTCGGTTDLPENVWGGGKIAGFRHRVTCGFCKLSPRYRWSFDIEREEAQARIRKALFRDGRFSDLGASALRARLVSLQIAAKDAFGRVAQVATLWSIPGLGTRAIRFTGSRLRDWLGEAGRTSSSRFDLVETPTGYRLTGRGFGHGVGLCQWGAKGMGDQGYSMVSILKHYYPNARLAKLW